MLSVLLQSALTLQNTVGSFSGLPGYAGPPAMVLGMRTHTVTAEVTRRGQTVKSVSQIKNYTKETGEITIFLPSNVRTGTTVSARNGVLGTVRATWDGEPVTFALDPERLNEIATPTEFSFDGKLRATVVVKPEGTHNLTVEYKSLLASTFAEDLQTFAYDVRFAPHWRHGPIEQLSLSLRYQQLPDGQSAVFAVDTTYPRGWQVGNAIGPGQQGAYFGARDFQVGEVLNERRPITFTYYAGGF